MTRNTRRRIAAIKQGEIIAECREMLRLTADMMATKEHNITASLYFSFLWNGMSHEEAVQAIAEQR